MSRSPSRAPRPTTGTMPALLAALVASTLLAIVAGCAEGPQDASPTACDPLADDCPADTRCQVVAQGARCLVPEPPPAGAACGAASCPIGEACTTVEGVLACRPLCDPDGDRRACPDGLACGYRLSVLGLGVCPAQCGDCTTGSTCAPTTALPYPTCVEIGPGAPGEACGEVRCGAGLACLATDGGETRCTPTCRVDGDCPDGPCDGVIVGVEGIGYCSGG